ncbi:hypothetical protein KP509_04G110600 [Ceratopteris richardii]|uniref:Inositol polyphosphate-related phosphatase domain-containing protein n=1 Tax=Ceratopteris richardii TaxID=49495 RepID=A0A8T2V3W1_CERRI|nr:hypothetical protein KP509_04G110600 [Ceratopteris richardii]
MMMKKWFNIKTSSADAFSADELSPDEHEDTDVDKEREIEDESQDARFIDLQNHANKGFSNFMSMEDIQDDENGRKRIRYQRRHSNTFYRESIRREELRIAVGTWNVAGKAPPSKLDLEDWLGMNDPAEVYVLGFQEIVPLKAGKVFGAEDTGPATKWQTLIRRTLNKRSQKKCKSHSAPSSPTGEVTSEEFDTSSSDAEIDANRIVIDEKTSLVPLDTSLALTKSHDDVEMGISNPNLLEVYRQTECIGLDVDHAKRTASEPICFDILQGVLTDDDSSVRPSMPPLSKVLAELTEPVRCQSKYVRVASKQMVGIHISIWVRRKLRRYVHNVTVSCVGLGIMGCLGNKGSISVSMMLHETSFCFVCTHLTSGEKEGAQSRRNSDVAEVLKRTYFPSAKLVDTNIPNTIWGHDRIIWFGDLNYRLNTVDSEARFLVAREDWTALLQKDQLRKEMQKGGVFHGWHEGVVAFAPTYKYAIDSSCYAGEGGKHGEKRRTPAWCDRILWHGKGLKQLSYRREELTLSDHRPLIAVFNAEVEAVHDCKIRKPLNLKTAKMEIEEILARDELCKMIKNCQYVEVSVILVLRAGFYHPLLQSIVLKTNVICIFVSIYFIRQR